MDPATGDLLLSWVGGDSSGWHVYVARSTDRGAAWSAPVRVTDREHDVHPHGESSPRLVAGPGGTLAVAWTNSVPAPGRRWPGSNIRFARSTDGGHTWEAAITLNDDSARGPAGHIFHGAAWAADSTLLVAWMDERGGVTPMDAEVDPQVEAVAVFMSTTGMVRATAPLVLRLLTVIARVAVLLASLLSDCVLSASIVMVIV